MKFSWKIFFITFLIIITSFGVGGFLLINTVFTNTLNNRIDSAKKNNNYITTALSVYADNNQPTYGNLEYLRVSAIGFAKQIAGNSDSKIKIGSINELSFSAENEFAHGMSVNSRKSRVVTENKKYYIQTISKIQLVTKSCYIETVDNITSVYSDRDMYCTIYQFILIGVALFASILLVIFSKLLTRPLVKLKDASKEVAEGNFNMRVKESHGITSSTEITELSQSFNTMADYVEDYIERLITFQQKYPVPFVFVHGNEMFVTEVNDRVQAVSDLIEIPVPPVASIEEARGKDILQIMGYFTAEEEKETDIFGKVLTHCEPMRWYPLFADIIARGNSKSTGIDKVLAYFDIDLKDTMAFGDGGNDIPMLKHVTTGIAMGNAEPHVKAVADYVTTSVDEDGIANALKHFGLI